MKNFLNSLRIVSVVAVLAVGVSYVFAWSEPTVNPPANTAAPIHTGEILQQKQGSIWSKKVLVSPISIFKKSIFLPGNKSALRIGSDDTGSGTQSFTKGSAGAITQDFNTALFGETDSIPLVIDLHDRAKPRDAIEFITDQACPIVTRFTNDKAAAFEFKKGTARANIIARQVRLTGGDPDANDVLVGDADGNARWAKASVNANGVVVFSSGTSPVPAGQTCQISPVICNDPAANNYNRVGACTYSSDPVQVKQWYCHIASNTWHEVSPASGCHGEFYPAGYSFADTQSVCSKVKPLDSSCVIDNNTAQYPFYTVEKNQRYVCDKVLNTGFYPGSTVCY